MKVKFLQVTHIRITSGRSRAYQPGSIATVRKSTAERLIAAGMAQQVASKE